MRPAALANQYEIILTQIWDENTLTIGTNGMNGNRDPTADILIYRKRDHQLMNQVTLRYTSSQNISYQNRACAVSRALKTLMGTYRGVTVMNQADYNDPAGYYMVWERCCRNEDINNIVAPGGSGMTFYLEFSPLSIQSASPEFSAPNGAYICKDQPFKMSMAARDDDGDELRYSLVTPLRGHTTPSRPTGDATPKNGFYPEVVWEAGISAQNAIPGNPALSIHPRTGELTVTASTLGLYVFAVQCEEYRNGQRIGLVRRDFQLLVIECNPTTPPDPLVTYQQQRVERLEFCSERPLTLETSDSPDWAYQWQLNGLNLVGETNARITVQDTGRYSVVKSFRTICSRDTASQVVEVIFGQDPPAVINRDAEIFCQGDQLRLLANDGTKVPTYTYQWQQGTRALTTTDAFCVVEQAGTYRLLITDEANGCQASDSVAIAVESVEATLPPRQSVQRGGSIRLVPTVSPGGGTYEYAWTPTPGLISATDSVTTATPSETTTYTFTVTSPLGCQAEASVEVLVFDKVYIPDAFSPNGDGINDLWEIRNAQDQLEEISVYNRWGELVFHAKSYEVPWNGRYLGVQVPGGTYQYSIKTIHHHYKGAVLVMY